MQTTLIVPVENQVREFDAKLLLACAAAERGFRVVIGSLRYIEFLAPHLPRGIYLAKSMTPIGQQMLRWIHALGHNVVAWDEESLVRYDAPDYPHWRFSPRAFRLMDHLFAWGQDDAELFAQYEGYHGAPIHATGNPRTDLLRPELREYFRPQVDELKDRHGDFILINTNFAFVNHFTAHKNLWQGAGKGEGGRGVAKIGRGMSAEFACGQSQHVQALFNAFKALLPVLSASFPDHNIVLRPHPSENHQTWREFGRAYANVRVIHEGNVAPWLMASKVLIHNGCTTAVEAAVLGRPVVSYQPVRAAQHDYHLPNALGHTACSAHEVSDLVAAVLAGELGPIDDAERRRLFERHLASAEGALAVDRVMDVLEQAAHSRQAPARSATAWALANGRTLIKMVKAQWPGSGSSSRYHLQRFPEITTEQVRERIARFSRLLGRFEGVAVKACAPFTFRIDGPRSSVSG